MCGSHRIGSGTPRVASDPQRHSASPIGPVETLYGSLATSRDTLRVACAVAASDPQRRSARVASNPQRHSASPIGPVETLYGSLATSRDTLRVACAVAASDPQRHSARVLLEHPVLSVRRLIVVEYSDPDIRRQANPLREI